MFGSERAVGICGERASRFAWEFEFKSGAIRSFRP